MGYKTGARLSKKTVRSRRPAGPRCSSTAARPASCASSTKMLEYADFRGNRQYVTTGNVAANDRVSLFRTDYAHQRRLKIFGRMRMTDARDDPALAAKLAVPDYPGRIERTVRITVETF